MQAVQSTIPTLWRTTIAGSQHYGNQFQTHVSQITCSNEDCSRKRGLWGGKHDCWQVCGIPGQSIRCWVSSHYLEDHSYGKHCESTQECNILYHFKWSNATQAGIFYPFVQVWCLVGGIQCSCALENHRQGHNTFWMYRDASCKQYVIVISANGFKCLFHHWYIWTGIYQQW